MIDSHYKIGSGHKVCQDYTLTLGDHSIIVCDGCSGSPHSDMGARLLAFSSSVCMPDLATKDIYTKEDFESPTLKEYREVFRLSPDATLMLANMDGYVRVFGDGYVAARSRHTHKWEIYRIEFQKNMPAYVSYLLDEEVGLSYLHSNVMYTVEHLQEGDWSVVDQGYPFAQDKDGNLTLEGFQRHFSPEDYNLICLMTDGAGSFTKDGEMVDDKEVLQELLKVKTTMGSFIQRRMKAFFKRHASKEGWDHFDDLGMAGIRLEEP